MGLWLVMKMDGIREVLANNVHILREGFDGAEKLLVFQIAKDLVTKLDRVDAGERRPEILDESGIVAPCGDGLDDLVEMQIGKAGRRGCRPGLGPVLPTRKQDALKYRWRVIGK